MSHVPARNVQFNGVTLDQQGMQLLAQLESYTGVQIPNGAYWYDPVSGATGPWGGPMAAAIPAGLPLGGTLRPEASGGGSGLVTGVFVNGRELHPQDVAALRTFMQVMPGRYWVDAAGNSGQEGGPPLFNLYALAQQAAAARGGRGHTSKWGPGTTWSGGGAASSTWGQDGGRITNHCSYDPSDGAGVISTKTVNW